MSNSYKEYLIYKYNYEGAIEEDGAFLLYRTFQDTSELNIGEIFVPFQKRNDGLATKLANQVLMIAKAKGLKYLSCQTQITGKGDEISMIAILSFGFKPIRAEGNTVTYMREVQ